MKPMKHPHPGKEKLLYGESLEEEERMNFMD